MSYTGFFADRDLYEVAKDGDPSDGTWMLPVEDADEYPDDVFVTRTDEVTGDERTGAAPAGQLRVPPLRPRPPAQRQLLHARGPHPLRGQARPRRAARHSTTTPPSTAARGITEAAEILDLTICEPALGSGAFLNEAINQLAAEYLKRRQAELGETLDPDRYQRELQKVKAHFALHQSYGVDLNATAVELAEVSLWLNCMYPGLQGTVVRAPAAARQQPDRLPTGHLADEPARRPPVGQDQEGQGPAPGRPQARPTARSTPTRSTTSSCPATAGPPSPTARKPRSFAPTRSKRLKEWRKTILTAPKKTDADRLTALAAGVERMWASAAERIRLIQQRLRRPIDVYGATERRRRRASLSRAEAEALLDDPDSPLGRLRTLMDAWVGLWFWPLDTGEKPPTWGQWLQVAEELIRPDERHGLTGQLDLFDDLADARRAEQAKRSARRPVAELRERTPVAGVSPSTPRSARAPGTGTSSSLRCSGSGGFDLQVGNPPWVRPGWYGGPGARRVSTRGGALPRGPPEQPRRIAGRRPRQSWQPGGLPSRAGSAPRASPRSSVRRSCARSSPASETNLYMVFMDTTWRHLAERGTVGLLHPESHFTDSKAGASVGARYRHLRRHWQFYNELRLFEEIQHRPSSAITCLRRRP